MGSASQSQSLGNLPLVFSSVFMCVGINRHGSTAVGTVSHVIIRPLCQCAAFPIVPSLYWFSGEARARRKWSLAQHLWLLSVSSAAPATSDRSISFAALLPVPSILHCQKPQPVALLIHIMQETVPTFGACFTGQRSPLLAVTGQRCQTFLQTHGRSCH
eukprot:COSAG02_NODE_1422_length_12685_cov_69.610361_2_plen_159_part_00